MRWLLVLCLLVLAGPVRAEWVVGESDHFRVYARESEKYVREKVALLEDYRSLLLMLTNAKAEARADDPKLDVYLLRNATEANRICRKLGRAGGYYTSSLAGVATFVNTTSQGQALLLHEYAHHFMYSSGFSVYPSWYEEGFAEYFMTAEFRPDFVEYGRANWDRSYLLRANRWLPLKDILEGRDYRSSSGDGVFMFYAQSWLLTHYMFRVEGQRAKLKAYLMALGEGEDSVQAFRTHVDPDLEGFQVKLGNYFGQQKRTFSRWKRSPVTPAKVQVRHLPKAADDLLLLLVDLELAGDSKETRARALDLVPKAAARHPGDPMAERALALLALRFGERDEAVQRLDRLLETMPDDPALLLWRARAAIVEGAEDQIEARRYLTRSFRANPQDWRTLHSYAVLQGARKKKLSENDMNVLGLAWELAPQVPEIAIDLAVAYVRQGKPDTAARILRPVANSVHDSPMKRFAGRLRGFAVDGDVDGFLHALSKPEEVLEDEAAEEAR
jgi:tetratricopeptide (TPR) repeat protein